MRKKKKGEAKAKLLRRNRFVCILRFRLGCGFLFGFLFSVAFLFAFSVSFSASFVFFVFFFRFSFSFIFQSACVLRAPNSEAFVVCVRKAPSSLERAEAAMWRGRVEPAWSGRSDLT